MRPKAKELAQHDGPLGRLEENETAGCDFVRDGRSMPPTLTDRLPQSGAAKLRESANSSCCCSCSSLTKCTQATAMMEITHGASRHFSSNTHTASLMTTLAKGEGVRLGGGGD